MKYLITIFLSLVFCMAINAKPHCQGFNNYNDKVSITFTDETSDDRYVVSEVRLIPTWKGKKYTPRSVNVTVNNGVATVTLTFDHLTQFSNPKVELKVNGKKSSFKVCQ